MMASERLEEYLKEHEEKRKRGEIGPVEFYRALLEAVSLLKEELLKEEISDDLAKRQIPLLLTFLKSQINELKLRSN
jgi:hypothetical protein